VLRQGDDAVDGGAAATTGAGASPSPSAATAATTAATGGGAPVPAQLPAAAARAERLRAVATALALLEAPEYASTVGGMTLLQAVVHSGALGPEPLPNLDVGFGRIIGHGAGPAVAAYHPDPAGEEDAAARERHDAAAAAAAAAEGGGDGGKGDPASPAALRFEHMRRVSQIFQDPRKGAALAERAARRPASANPHLQRALTFRRAAAILQEAGGFTALSRVGLAPAAVPYAVDPQALEARATEADVFLQRVAHAVGGALEAPLAAAKRRAAVFDGDPSRPVPVFGGDAAAGGDGDAPAGGAPPKGDGSADDSDGEGGASGGGGTAGPASSA
jgi:hypothetical protein